MYLHKTRSRRETRSEVITAGALIGVPWYSRAPLSARHDEDDNDGNDDL